MIYRYIYKITCTTGYFKDHFYFGQRTTRINPLIDKYKGSGKLLGDYYKKHPNDYIKEIISYHNSKEELNKAEYDIIHPWLGNELCLNICEGGKGGSHKHTNESKQKISKGNKGKKRSKETCLLYSELAKRRKTNPMYGKHHTEESKQLMSLHKKGQKSWCKGIKDIHKGDKNPMYNKHHTEESKQLISLHRRGIKHSNEWKIEQSKTIKDRKLLNDNYNQYLLKPEYWGEFIDIGFKFGKLY